MPDIPIISFNAGVLSPHIDARSDIEKYRSGCRILHNMIPRVYGDAERRPGTKYIAEVVDMSVVSRLVPFVYSSTVAYVLEFSDQIIRVYYEGEQVGEDVVSPYLEADLFELQFKQSADVLWIVHSSYAPRKLSRTTATTFSLDTITFDKGPFIDRNDIANDDGVTIAVTGYSIATATAGVAGAGTFTITSTTDISSLFPANKRFYVTDSTGNDRAYTVHATTASSYMGTTLTVYANETIADGTDDGQIMVAGGTVTLTASSATFVTGDSGHTGGLFKIRLPRVHTETNGSKATTLTGAVGDALDVKGTFNFTTRGTWDATIKLQRMEDGTNWEDYRTYVSTKDGNAQYTLTEEADNVQYRMYVSVHGVSSTVYGQLTVNDSTQDGIFRITDVASTTSATATAIVAIPANTASKRWYEGAWSAVRGYPNSFSFFEERAVYGGTSENAQQLWFSATGDYEDFEEGVNDSDSFSLILPEANRIQWLESLDTLVTGTSGGEWLIGAKSSTSPLTPTNFTVRQQTSYGSASIQAVKVNEAVLFVDYVQRKVRELTFVDAEQKYASPDLTALAEHVTAGKIKAYAYQRNPDSILWCVLEDGTLASMVYERNENVVAWSTHELGCDGVVESICVIPGSDEDEVWFTVYRQLPAEHVRYIEQMQPRNFGAQEDAVFVDSAISREVAAVQNIRYVGTTVRYGEGEYGIGPYGGIV